LSAGVNGGPSRGSSIRGPGSEDPIVRRRTRFCYALYSLIIILKTMFMHILFCI
jgi:hypothetical protein